MAYELAWAGLSVCLLERGKKYAPGDFPRNPYEMRFNFWDPGKGLHGLFNIWSFKGTDAIVSSGLGGGSLIYANVLLRKPAETFKGWLIDAEELEPHYQEVLAMLDAQHYPGDRAPYNQSLKGVRLSDAAARLHKAYGQFSANEDAEPGKQLLLGVAFAGAREHPGAPVDVGRPNTHDRQRYTCRLCGECDIGCNSGSKNTLDFNYLADAEFVYDAEIVARCEVRAFLPIDEGERPAGYRVQYVDYESDAEPAWVTAGQLILAAGTIGTTNLMLHQAEQLPRLNERALGKRFSGNGDLLGFVRLPRRGMPAPGQTSMRDHSYGPVITTAVYQPGGPSGGAFFIEDAGYPLFLSWIFHLGPFSLLRRWREMFTRMNLVAGLILRYIDESMAAAEELLNEQQALPPAPAVRRAWADARRRISRSRRWAYRRFVRMVSTAGQYRATWPDLSDEFSQLLEIFEGSGEVVPLLAVGEDTPDGQMYLSADAFGADSQHNLQVRWSKEGRSKQYYDRVEAIMRQLADEMGGTFQRNPIERFRRGVTVHPLGGCPMDTTDERGVVDRTGQVHGYPGLFIADGSVIPGPVVANPALTIAALARHFSATVIQNHYEALVSDVS
jgi:cholesterol oxidase